MSLTSLSNQRDLICFQQIAYKPTTNGINEHKTDVKPLLKDLESRIVFTKCKPFKLAIPGRQWIFGN